MRLVSQRKSYGREKKFLSSLVQSLRLVFLLMAAMAGLSPAKAIESVRVPLEAQAIDLTKAFETYHSDSDRLLVSTAPGLDRFCAHQRYQRTDREAAGGAAFPAGRFRGDLARSRRITHFRDHREPGLSNRTG